MLVQAAIAILLRVLSQPATICCCKCQATSMLHNAFRLTPVKILQQQDIILSNCTAEWHDGCVALIEC